METHREHRRSLVTRRRGPRAGFTLVELLVAMSVLLVAASIFYRLLASTTQLRGMNRENAVAVDAARVCLEQMRNRDFRELWSLYNDDPADDPGGPGTAPGRRFVVEELDPLPGSTDDTVGEVILPAQLTQVEVTTQTGGKLLGGTTTTIVDELWLREDVVDPELGLPRDLNGDNVVDSENHAGDYLILPVCIVVRWQGQFGERSLRVVTMLTDFEVGR